MNEFIYFAATLIATSWLVWLFGGMLYILWWQITCTWHPWRRLLARSFFLALVLTPTYYDGHPSALAPAISVFYYDGVDDWFIHGIIPLLFGWLAIFLVFLVIDDLKRALRG